MKIFYHTLGCLIQRYSLYYIAIFCLGCAKSPPKLFDMRHTSGGEFLIISGLQAFEILVQSFVSTRILLSALDRSFFQIQKTDIIRPDFKSNVKYLTLNTFQVLFSTNIFQRRFVNLFSGQLLFKRIRDSPIIKN